MTEDSGMEKETQRSAEMRQLVRDYQGSGLARREFCEQRGISLTTFDYWRGVQSPETTRMVKVEVAGDRRGVWVHSEPGQRPSDREFLALYGCGTDAVDPHRRKRVDVRAGGGDEDLHRHRSHRHAQGVRRIARAGARPSGARSVERSLVFIQQSNANAAESSGVGRERIVGVRETSGEGAVSLAGGGGRRSVTMRAEELAMLVNGLDLKQAQPRKWYRKSA